MSELALRDESAVALQADRIIQRSGGIYERDIIDGWIQVLADVSNLANFIAETDFVPRALRNRPAAVAACILTGRELSIGPMQSLKVIHMVQGVPSLSAEYKRARALAAGHDIAIDETNTTRCVIRGRRKNTERWVTIKWDIDMARRAKLAGKDVWQQYPQRMLQARASGELCDLLFPDASLGLATTEVLEDGGIVTENGEIIDAATGELTTRTAAAIEAPKPRTAQRKQRTQTASPATSHPPAAPASPPPAGAGEALPPLPGEDEPPADPSGPVTPDQLKAIWTALGTVYLFGDDEKDQARGICGQILNRQLASSKDMSKAEASTVLDTLSHWQHQAEKEGEVPRGYLMLMLQAMAGDPREQDGDGGE